MVSVPRNRYGKLTAVPEGLFRLPGTYLPSFHVEQLRHAALRLLQPPRGLPDTF